MVTAANLPLYLIGGFALIKLFQRGQIVTDAPRRLRATALLSSAFAAWAFYGMGAEAFWWSLLLGGASLPVYWLMRRTHKALPAAAIKITQ
jgi:APA family basic amino acid/polyamine antiporter